MVQHHETDDRDNVLLQGQTVSAVKDDEAVFCPLQPGQASFHHGWTLHASMANQSDDRRIGLNVQFLATHVRQTKHDSDSAMLVRGVDEYQHFKADKPASRDLDLLILHGKRHLKTHMWPSQAQQITHNWY